MPKFLQRFYFLIGYQPYYLSTWLRITTDTFLKTRLHFWTHCCDVSVCKSRLYVLMIPTFSSFPVLNMKRQLVLITEVSSLCPPASSFKFSLIQTIHNTVLSGTAHWFYQRWPPSTQFSVLLLIFHGSATQNKPFKCCGF